LHQTKKPLKNFTNVGTICPIFNYKFTEKNRTVSDYQFNLIFGSLDLSGKLDYKTHIDN
jgi:hypothetical protein